MSARLVQNVGVTLYVLDNEPGLTITEITALVNPANHGLLS